MRLAVIAGILFAANAAQAEGIGSVQGMLGFSAESDVDKIKVKANGAKQEFDGDDEDLESNFGLSAAYEFVMSPSIVLGPRLAVMTSEGDDSENTIRTIDAGGIGRFFFNDGPWRGFAALGLGASYAMVSNDDSDLDASGIGFHFLLGGGVQGNLSASVGFIGGLYYSYQSFSSIEGDAKLNGTKVDAEFKDAKATRPMLMAGVTF